MCINAIIAHYLGAKLHFFLHSTKYLGDKTLKKHFHPKNPQKYKIKSAEFWQKTPKAAPESLLLKYGFLNFFKKSLERRRLLACSPAL